MLDEAVKQRLSLYVDNEMQPQEAVRLALLAERNQESCAYLERQLMLGEFLRSSKSGEPVFMSGLADRVQQAVSAEPLILAPAALPKSRKWESLISSAVAASLVATMVYVGFALQRDGGFLPDGTLASNTGIAVTQASMDTGLENYVLMHTQSANTSSESVLPYLRMVSYEHGATR